MSEIYRFRSTRQLLEKPYRELQRQSVYFASPEQLNDPMEGFRDIVWSGDKIIWKNLFKHYLYCLHWTYLHTKLFGDQIALEADHIPVEGRWDEPPTPQMGELFNEIWSKIYADLRLSELVDKIAATRSKVRYSELLFYLDHIHLQAIARIQNVYVERGLVPETERTQDSSVFGEFILSESSFFELIPEAEARYEKFSEIMFSISYQMRIGQRLMHCYRLHTLKGGPFEVADGNRQLLLLDFPNIYVDQVGKLLGPQWYTACFMKGYHNTSLWANYGESHKGVCLIFETEAAETTDARTLELKTQTGSSFGAQGESRKDYWSFRPFSFDDVSYSGRPGEIDFFRNISVLPMETIMKLWYTGEGKTSECASHIRDLSTWQRTLWDQYRRDILLKSEDWAHEQECRLVLHPLLETSLDIHHRTLTYHFHSLKGIIFGIRTSTEDKLKIFDIVQGKCSEHNRSEFKFFQAYYCADHGDIRKHDIGLGIDDLVQVGPTRT